jgi:hypothetical protein
MHWGGDEYGFGLIFSHMKEKPSEMKLFEKSVIYNIVTVMLLKYVKELGADQYLGMIEEPLEGNPLYINYQGKRISQDILTSCINAHSLSKGLDLNKVSSIIEIGAGFGRLAYLLKNQFDIKYIIVDILPALFISQTYLSSVFKGKRIFSFREFSSFAEIKDEFENCDLIFLMPDQLQFLPEKSIDLFVAINCLQEFEKETVNLYFDHSDRLAKNIYFQAAQNPPFKDAQNSLNPLKEDFYSFENYPIKKNWDAEYSNVCPFPKSYSEAFYKIL